MNGCACCAEALQRPESVMFERGCTECSARALAGSPWYFESRRINRLVPEYREALQVVFGADWPHGHQMVLAWSDRIRDARQQAKHG